VINFPGSFDDADSLIRHNNNVSATLTAGINNSVLLIPVSSPSSFSASGVVTITDSLTSPTKTEIVIYASKSGSDLVVPAGGRGAEGTTPQSFSAGHFVEQRVTARSFGVLADSIIAVQQKIGDGSTVHPLDASGTNIAGVNLDLSGGKGTGNATPGRVSIRYPLIGASGSTVQSLSSGAFPLVTNMFTGALKTIANTAAETSLFGTASAGSTLTIEAGMARVTQIYRVTIPVFFTTTGTPTGRLQIKLGGTVIADSGAVAFPTATLQSRGCITGDLVVTAIGASGGVQCEPLAFWYTDAGSAAGHNAIRVLTAGGSGPGAIDLTPARAIDMTWTWGTANASNAFTAICQSVDIVR
jgi:hypothetical protein